jgi:hypothetical protein
MSCLAMFVSSGLYSCQTFTLTTSVVTGRRITPRPRVSSQLGLDGARFPILYNIVFDSRTHAKIQFTVTLLLGQFSVKFEDLLDLSTSIFDDQYKLSKIFVLDLGRL